MLGIDDCDWFILPLLLPTPTMQFSLDHKRNGCSASDSDSLIFTTSYRSALLNYDSDSVASENQPLRATVNTSLELQIPCAL